MTSRRVLVTGGAGLIGSALIWHLNRIGIDDIVVVDRLGTGEKWRHLVPLRFRDYMEADELAALVNERPGKLQEIGAVFHLGACSSTTETDATYLAQNNFAYTKMLAEWAVAGGRRFLYASSAATYGALETGLSEDLDPSELRPLNMYGYSKAMFDAYALRTGLIERVVGLKYFNIYGPNEDHKADMRSVVAKAFDTVRTEGEIKLFKSYREGIGDGEQTRDFLYVKDAVAMTVHLAATAGTRGLYNIGSGISRNWNDLARSVFAALDLPAKIRYIEMPATLQPKYQYATKATLDKIRATGFDQPVMTLEEGVADYVRAYLVPDRRLGEEQLLQGAAPGGKVTPIRSVRQS